MKIARFILMLALPLTLAACGAEHKAQEDASSGNSQKDAYNSHVQWLHDHAPEYEQMNVAQLQEFEGHLDGLIQTGNSLLFYAEQPNVSYPESEKEKVRRSVSNAETLKPRVHHRIREMMRRSAS